MKKFTILALLLMLIGIAAADVYTIGDGTSTQSYIPFYGLYDYGWSKVAYTAAELSTAGLSAGQIDGIGFEVGNNPLNYVSVDQRVFIRHTTATELDATYPDNNQFQNVYQADYTWNGGGWHHIMFSSPFIWDGTSNIEILWENWDGAWASGPSFTYTSTSPSYLAAYKYQDGSFLTTDGATTYSRPNIQIVTPSTNPPAPATLVSPAHQSTLTDAIVTLSWNASDGAIPTGYTLFYGTTNPPLNEVDLGPLTSHVLNDLPFNTLYYWQVVPYNAMGSATGCPIWEFTTMDDPTIDTFPWEEDFGTIAADWPAQNWSQLSGLYGAETPASGTQWYRYNWLHGAAGNNAAKINIYGSSIDGWLVTPPIALPGNGYELKFDLGLTGYGNSNPIEDPAGQLDDRFIVFISDSPTMENPTILREWNNSGSSFVYNEIPNTGTTVILDLDSYTGTYYVAFYGESTESNGDNDLFVDNVIVRETPAGAIFSYNPSEIDFGQVTNGLLVGPQNVTITNTGAGTLDVASGDISISGTNAAEFSFDNANLPAALGANESVNIPVYVTGVTEGPISATLSIMNNSTQYDVALTADVLPAGIIAIGSGTVNNNLPVNPFYGYTYSQSIFLQNEIGIADQRIEKIYYYWNGAGATVNTNDWIIYMGHTSADAFASTTDWLPLANLTQVYSGVVAAPAVAGWVEIVLDTPFAYNNTDNLVVAVDENTPSYDTSGWYYYSTPTATSRSLRYYSDSTNPDPAAPVAGTLVSAYPNIMMQFGEIPMVPPGTPTLVYPADGETGLPKAGFDLSWTPDIAAGMPDYYGVYIASSPETIYDEEYFETSVAHFNPVEDGGMTFNYEDRWYWTVQAFNSYGSALQETPAWFDIEADPTVYVTDENPLFEGFEDPIFPANNWALISGAGNWTQSTTASGYDGSTASAFANFYNISGTTPFSLVSPIMDISALTTPVLIFDYAYATYAGEVDRMDVYYSTDGGLNYSVLLEMPGGTDGILNTGGTTTGSFVPTGEQWGTQLLPLPTGTNMLKFSATSAYGNNLYLDNIIVDNMPVFWDLTMLDPVGSGEVIPAIGSHTYTEDTVVNLNAQPGLGWFEKWEVDGSLYSTERIAPITMDADYEAQAFFSLPAGSLAEDFNLGDPVPGDWTESANSVTWETGDDTFFFNMFDDFALIGQVLADPEERLVTPEVILDGTVNKLSYWLAGGNNVYGYGSSTVQVKYKLAEASLWTNLGDPIDLANGEGPMYVTLDLSAIPNGTYQFAFAVSSTFDYSTYLSWVGIDNVVGPRLASVSTNDLSVTKVNYPNQIITEGETAVLSATIKNTGLNTQSGTQVTFTIDDGRTVLTTNIGTLDYNETEIVTVNYTAVGGRHSITASVPADENLANNSATTQGVIAEASHMAEGFEGVIEGWYADEYWALNSIDWLPPYEGALALYCYGATFAESRLIGPQVVLTGSEELNFYASFGNQSTGAATLAVDYSADGVTWTNILPAFAPGETSQLYTVDLSSIPAGVYYLSFVGSGTSDGTYNTILSLDMIIGPELLIGAPENVSIAMNAGVTTLSWDAVPEAQSYRVYAGNDPYGDFTLLEAIADTSYEVNTNDAMKFYHVTSSKDALRGSLAKNTEIVSPFSPNYHVPQMKTDNPSQNVKTRIVNRQKLVLPKK